MLKNLTLAVSFLFLGGCTLAGAYAARELSPAQIKELKEAGKDVYGCVNVSGPPPMGGVTFIIVPHGVKVDVAFSPSCQLLTGKVGVD